MGYDNIMNLTKQHNLRKIMIMRDTWEFGSWCIVNKVIFDTNGYGSAYGFTHYKNGNTHHGEIECAGCYSWRVVKVLNDPLEVEYAK